MMGVQNKGYSSLLVASRDDTVLHLNKISIGLLSTRTILCKTAIFPHCILDLEKKGGHLSRAFHCLMSNIPVAFFNATRLQCSTGIKGYCDVGQIQFVWSFPSGGIKFGIKLNSVHQLKYFATTGFMCTMGSRRVGHD